MRIKLLIYKTKGRFFGADAGLGPDSDDTVLPVTRKMKDFLLSGKPAEAQLSETLHCPHFTPRERETAPLGARFSSSKLGLQLRVRDRINLTR